MPSGAAEFGRILAGDYPLRADDRETSFTDTAKEAARTYRTRIEESSDPLVGAVRGLGATVGTAAERASSTGSVGWPADPGL